MFKVYHKVYYMLDSNTFQAEHTQGWTLNHWSTSIQVSVELKFIADKWAWSWETVKYVIIQSISMLM